MKRFISLCVLSFLFLDLFSQINKYGVPFIDNYPTTMTFGSEQNWCIEKDKFGNIYFGNQDKGVIRYDGTKWSKIQVANNPRIYSLKSDDRGIIFVGAAYEFGYLQPDERGKMEYISLASRLESKAEIRLIYSIEIIDNKVHYLSPKFIYIYDIAKDVLSKIDILKFNLSDAFRLFRVNDKYLIADNGKGMMELKDSLIVPLPNGETFQNMRCTVILPFSETKVLVCTFYDGLFVYDYSTGAVNSDFIDKNLNEKLKTISVYAAAKINEDLFAIGTTQEEGILIINKSGEVVQQIKRENSELEDNSILALYCDYKNKGELWISTLGFVSKAYFNIPLTKFNEKHGLENAVNDISIFQGEIYLSSDAGIYKSSTDPQNNLIFKKISATTRQVFPLEVIESSRGDFLLAGKLDGVLQIFKDQSFRTIESVCRNLPRGTSSQLDAKKIAQSRKDEDIVYLGLQAGGVMIMKNNGSTWSYVNRIKGFPGQVSGIVEKNDGGLWLSTDDPSAIYSVSISGNDTSVVQYKADKGIPEEVEINSINLIFDVFYVATSNGLVKYDKTTDTFLNGNDLTAGFSEGKSVQNLFVDNENDLWLSGLDNSYFEILFHPGTELKGGYTGVLSLLPEVPTLDILNVGKMVYMTKSKTLALIDKSGLLTDTSRVSTMFTSITVGTDSVIMSGSFPVPIDELRRVPDVIQPGKVVPEYSYDMNEITFEWTTPDYTEELRTEYSYMLEGYDEGWSKWEGISFGYSTEALYPKKEYFNLPYGHYTFRVRTRTLTGRENNELKYEFIIRKPWYATVVAFIFFALAAFLAIYGIIAAYTRRLKNENIRLEGIVAERTAVVVKQKEELESSIHYASRIQMALLPSETILSDNIKNYFILFKPRDIVSGDYYWMTKKGDRLYIVAADCTGHGVPGAFMSLLGMSFLDEIIDKQLSPRADEILNEMRQHITESLKQSGAENESKDGMDMALLVIDFNTNKIEFSGAYNPCFRVRKLAEGEASRYADDSSERPDGSMSNGKYLLETIYASKMPIGISARMDENFVFYDWALERGISYYLFSDGYIDQFGGPHGRKFMKKNFKKLILEIQDLTMDKQKEMLEKNLKEWMGQSPQIDDILVMGIRTE